MTTFDTDEFVYGAILAGASGFALKDCSPDGLVAAVRTVAAGEAMLAPSLIRRYWSVSSNDRREMRGRPP